MGVSCRNDHDDDDNYDSNSENDNVNVNTNNNNDDHEINNDNSIFRIPLMTVGVLVAVIPLDDAEVDVLYEIENPQVNSRNLD